MKKLKWKGFEVLTILKMKQDTEEASRKGYIYTIPIEHMDLAVIWDLIQQFRKLGIQFAMNDIYPAFKSKEELDRALLRVYNSGWKERWRIEDYLRKEGLIP